LEVQVQPSDLNEEAVPWSGDAKQHAQTLALAKLDGMANPKETSALIAADTIVVLDGQPMGKPISMDQARNMLMQLSGQTHEVMTGYVLAHASQKRSRVVTASVTFAQISPIWLETYLVQAHWRDKAGGYGIQEHAGAWVEKVKGSIDTIMGLPMAALLQDMKEMGVIQ
jgi:septum formation protein